MFSSSRFGTSGSQSVLREQYVVIGDQFAYLFTCPFYGPDAPIPNSPSRLNISFTFSDSETAWGTPGTHRGAPRTLPPPQTAAYPSYVSKSPPPYLLTSFLAGPVHFFSEKKKNPLNNFPRLKND